MAEPTNQSDNSAQSTGPQPGTVIAAPGSTITPSTQSSVAPAPAPQVGQSAPVQSPVPAPVQTPLPPQEPSAATPFMQSSEQADQFAEIPAPSASSRTPFEGQSISWTASEFIAHDKETSWYLSLAVATAVIAAVLYFLTKDKVTSSVVIIAGILLGIYGARKPRQVEYRVDGRGISVNARHYEYGLFRSFSIVPEGAFSSIVLMPLKRFSPPLTLYFAPNDEENIIDVLGSELPFKEHTPDLTDRFLRKIRF